MIAIEARLAELEAQGVRRRVRRVSGPQGPHVLVDGRPVLLLCSGNYLGLADHPRVREANADAARRWGVGTGASRLTSGTMTIHRRLEERLAAFVGRESALVFGSGYLANVGVSAALARPGDVVFCDERNHVSVLDGCRLSGAELFLYEHCDVEHLEWGIERAEGRGALIATDSVFTIEGDLAPLAEIVEVAGRHDVRLLVGEAESFGTVGPEGRGALAAAGLEAEVDVIVGTLDKALGSYGAFAACDRIMARYLTCAARTFMFSTALPPPAAAGALAALELLEERPRLVDRLATNAAILREELINHGLDVETSLAPIIALPTGDCELAFRIAESALTAGVMCEPVGPPSVPADAACLRLSVMATHREGELRAAARLLAREARAMGVRPPVRAPVPLPGAVEVTRRQPAGKTGGRGIIFDGEQPPVARAA